MNSTITRPALALTVGLALATAAHAGEVLVTSNITTATTWTADNTYNLQDQIYVEAGATLTIEPGTIVASTTNVGGSLAVANGGQIFVLGTKDRPVVMTSVADTDTWTNGDPRTGAWREAATEWGNLTIMGDAYIAEDATVGNVAHPDAGNIATMEGLDTGGAIDQYGGGDDEYDAGTLSYLSIRYGGKVIGLANELNGLSLGGIGRETDIHHVEIMNNVDDGIEIWGGTVNLKYVSIWNIGDDSFDIDQGWRGKAQFVLIVQGWSLDASQGSGVGDNCFETDGAEDSDYQPVTTAAIHNATVIGQPAAGDGGTAWRDNARVQYHSCVFMDLGERLVRFDNDDGDGASGYGHNGTTSWADTWTTDYTVTSTVNPAMLPLTPADLYQSQTSGKLAQITDSAFFRNFAGDAYTEATARGVFDAANDNVLMAGFQNALAPIQNIVRGPIVTKGTLSLARVVKLDPRAKNDAVDATSVAPNDGFFSSVRFRGAFSPTENWLCGWTAAHAFGLTECGPVGPPSFGLPGRTFLPLQ